MLSREEVVKWLWNNCRDVNNNLVLSYLDLRDFNDVCINELKVKRDLYVSHQEVGGDLHQVNQTVKGDIYSHKLKKDERWKERTHYVIRKKNLKKISPDELLEMGYILEEKTNVR